MALGDRANTELGLEKAKEYGIVTVDNVVCVTSTIPVLSNEELNFYLNFVDAIQLAIPITGKV